MPPTPALPEAARYSEKPSILLPRQFQLGAISVSRARKLHPALLVLVEPDPRRPADEARGRVETLTLRHRERRLGRFFRR